MRAVCTIATKECSKELGYLRASLSLAGWREPLHVYVPDNSGAFDLPDGCVRHPLAAWWAGCLDLANAPTMGKPEVFLSWPSGTDVLYLDGSDVLVFENPARLFDLFVERNYDGDGALLGMCPSCKKGTPVPTLGLHPRNPGQAMLARLLGDYATSLEANYNAGVIIMRVCEISRMAAWWWKTLLGQIPHVGPLRTSDTDPARRIAGEQTAANIVLRHLKADNRVFDLPSEWNVRRIKDGAFEYDSTRHRLTLGGGVPVCVAHQIGGGGFPPALLEAVTKNHKAGL